MMDIDEQREILATLSNFLVSYFKSTGLKHRAFFDFEHLCVFVEEGDPGMHTVMLGVDGKGFILDNEESVEDIEALLTILTDGKKGAADIKACSEVYNSYIYLRKLRYDLLDGIFDSIKESVMIFCMFSNENKTSYLAIILPDSNKISIQVENLEKEILDVSIRTELGHDLSTFKCNIADLEKSMLIELINNNIGIL